MTFSLPRSMIAGGLLVAVLLLTAAPARAAESSACLNTAIYVRADSLQRTLLATRARYQQWLEQQPSARQAVTFRPWLATQPRTADEADKLVRPAEGVDPNARLADGQPLWSPREELIDGKAVNFATGSAGTSVYLMRTASATNKTRLTIGLGGGDQLDVWLNGQKIASACTRLTSGRYGCSYQVDGTRVDQVLVDLELAEGENTLAVRLITGSEPSFYFSPSPQPVPRLWEQVRNDFPAAHHPLLDLVQADWFAADGWFAARDCQREQDFIRRRTDSRDISPGPGAWPDANRPRRLFRGRSLRQGQRRDSRGIRSSPAGQCGSGGPTLA